MNGSKVEWETKNESILFHRQVVFEGRVEKAFHPETRFDYMR